MTSRTPSRSFSSRAASAVACATVAAAGVLGFSCTLDKMPFKPDDSRTFAGDVTVSGAELNRGYQSYMRYCYACHGEQGDGKGPSAYALRPPPRDFTRGVFKFARMRGSDDFPNDADLIRIVKGGLHGTAMLPWDVPEDELGRILQYIKSFGPVLRCPASVEGAKSDIQDVDGGLTVTVTATEEASTSEIRARAKVLAEFSKLEAPGGALKHCAVVTQDTTIEASEVEGGSKITVKPREEGELDRLRQESRARLKEAGEHGAHADVGEQLYRGSRWEKTKKKKGDPDPKARMPYPVLDEWAPEDDPWVGKEEAAIQLGKELYHLKAECVNCHPGFDTKANLYSMSVEAAKRDSKNFSVLKGFRDDIYHSQPKKSEEYGGQIMPPDFTMDFVRSAHPESRVKDLYRILSFGVYPVMPAWKGAGLTDSDIYAIAHYVKWLIDRRGTPEALEMKASFNEQKPFEFPKVEEPKPAEPAGEAAPEEKKEGDPAAEKKDAAKPEEAKKDAPKPEEAKKDAPKPEEKK